MPSFPAPLRLRLDSAALISNWQWLSAQSGSARCGAAVKADGYGLGARAVIDRLADAGCRDFFVASWPEAEALGRLDTGLSLSVLHGVREEDMPLALTGIARPVLNTPTQVARWRDAAGGPCDVMIDTGINRLGLDWDADLASLLDGITVETLMSHLACADQDHPLNDVQRQRFAHVSAIQPARCYSLANSAGVCFGKPYHFDLTRPGLALYGGVPREEAAGHITPVVTPQIQVLQRRRVSTGESIGYNATFVATGDMELAVLNVGYADGYLRGFSNRGLVRAGGVEMPVIGRVSMDLLIVDCSAAPNLAEGDWVDIDYALPEAAAQSGLSQYELLTGLGRRYDRLWV